jgi:hypothetical protein
MAATVHNLLDPALRGGTLASSDRTANLTADRVTMIGLLPNPVDVADPDLTVDVFVQRARAATPNDWHPMIGLRWRGGETNRDGSARLPAATAKTAGIIQDGDKLRGRMVLSREVEIGLDAETE